MAYYFLKLNKDISGKTLSLINYYHSLFNTDILKLLMLINFFIAIFIYTSTYWFIL